MARVRKPKPCLPGSRDQAAHDRFLSGRRIAAPAITGAERAADLMDQAFLAYNAARLREGARLFVDKMLEPDVTVGVSISGALTPAGLGQSCFVPLIEAGFVDWIVSTGANLYHDLHFAFNYKMAAGDFRGDDAQYHAVGVVRIYDVLLSRDECLLATDVRLREILLKPEFQKTMGTAEFHHLLGQYAAQAEEEARLPHVSILAAAWRNEVPVYTSSPGDSTIGLEVAAIRFGGAKVGFDSVLDANETTAYFYTAKKSGGKTGVLLIGGGSPKNFMLQTAPHVTDSIGLEVKGHDFFFQITDARPDTGGLSGATPQEAVSWGKVDPDRIPDAVVCYLDSTVAVPLLSCYALARHKPRPLKRLYRRRLELTEILKADYLKHSSRTPR